MGLDPDITQIKKSVFSCVVDPIFGIQTFLQIVVSFTAPHACAFKLNEAFYKRYDGLLKSTIDYIKNEHPDMPVIVDCKIGDIDHTLKAHFDYYFDTLKADAITLSPYMGAEIFSPFVLDEKKAGIMVVKSSNTGSAEFQDSVLETNLTPWAIMLREFAAMNDSIQLPVDELSMMLWHKVLKTTKDYNVRKNLMVVIASSINPSECAYIRRVIGDDMPILVPGIGAQGGDLATVKNLLNSKGYGVLVNASRSILYPEAEADLDWCNAIVCAAIQLKNEINTLRK